MKLITLSLMMLFLTSNLHAQGIKFENDLNWGQVKAKAKADNKYIFIDCYTTWCGPCKSMSTNIFPKEIVGDYFNANFVSVALQMDSTSSDDLTIKNRYGLAKELSKICQITAFPTYLFFTPEGKVVHKFLGACKEPVEFVDKAREALNPNKQYYILVNQYKYHLQDSVFLKNALTAAIASSDEHHIDLISVAYLNVLKDPFNKEDLLLIEKGLKNSTDKAFNFYLANVQRVNAVFGKSYDYVTWRLSTIIIDENIIPLFNDSRKSPRWTNAVKLLKGKYPQLTDDLIKQANNVFKEGIVKQEIIPYFSDGFKGKSWTTLPQRIKTKYPDFDMREQFAKSDYEYYAFKKDWPAFEKAFVTYMNTYGANLGTMSLNVVLWKFVFLTPYNKNLLTKSLIWGKKLIEKYPNWLPMWWDTYANLLYKNGNREEALMWEKRALERSQDPRDNITIKETLVKMEKNERTWGD